MTSNESDSDESHSHVEHTGGADADEHTVEVTLPAVPAELLDAIGSDPATIVRAVRLWDALEDPESVLAAYQRGVAGDKAPPEPLVDD